MYSEVQGQIDLLLFDANQELHKVKSSLKKKFETAQKSDSKRKRDGQRRPRRDSRKENSETRDWSPKLVPNSILNEFWKKAENSPISGENFKKY